MSTQGSKPGSWVPKPYTEPLYTKNTSRPLLGFQHFCFGGCLSKNNLGAATHFQHGFERMLGFPCVLGIACHHDTIHHGLNSIGVRCPEAHDHEVSHWCARVSVPPA